LPVASILKLQGLIAHLESATTQDAALIAAIKQYRADYGIA
jgi:hypothetical protein